MLHGDNLAIARFKLEISAVTLYYNFWKIILITINLESVSTSDDASNQKSHVWWSLLIGLFFVGTYIFDTPTLVLSTITTLYFPISVIILILNPLILGLVTGLLLKEKWLKWGIILGVIYSVIIYVVAFQVRDLSGNILLGRISTFGGSLLEEALALILLFLIVFLAGLFIMKGLKRLTGRSLKLVALVNIVSFWLAGLFVVPFCVKHSFFICTFVAVGAEKVALGLNEILGEAGGDNGVVVGKGGAHCWNWNTVL